MIFISPELRRLAEENKNKYLIGNKVSVPKCSICAKPLTLEERERGTRCINCIKFLKK